MSQTLFALRDLGAISDLMEVPSVGLDATKFTLLEYFIQLLLQTISLIPPNIDIARSLPFHPF